MNQFAEQGVTARYVAQKARIELRSVNLLPAANFRNIIERVNTWATQQNINPCVYEVFVRGHQYEDTALLRGSVARVEIDMDTFLHENVLDMNAFPHVSLSIVNAANGIILQNCTAVTSYALTQCENLTAQSFPGAVIHKLTLQNCSSATHAVATTVRPIKLSFLDCDMDLTVDLSLCRAIRWTGPGTLIFDRCPARTVDVEPNAPVDFFAKLRPDTVILELEPNAVDVMPMFAQHVPRELVVVDLAHANYSEDILTRLFTMDGLRSVTLKGVVTGRILAYIARLALLQPYETAVSGVRVQGDFVERLSLALTRHHPSDVTHIYNVGRGYEFARAHAVNYARYRANRDAMRTLLLSARRNGYRESVPRELLEIIITFFNEPALPALRL